MITGEYESLRFVASESVPQVLREISSTVGLSLNDALLTRAESHRVPYLLEQFANFNLVTSPDMLVSGRGKACNCGVDLIEGGNIVDAIDQLREIDPSSKRITLVREGMTDLFIHLVRRLDSIRRIWICSPWVSLGKERLHAFASGIERSRRQHGFFPEITVVTRPVSEQPKGPSNETIQYLGRVNAVVTYRSNLHSKLYIVESATTPTQRHAFVGSENFTKVRYQEVGIRVNNDNQLIDDLVRYFLALT